MAAAGSLVSAVREKYCSDPEDEPSNFINIGKINQTAIILAPSSGGCPVEKRKSLVLDKLEVVCAGDEVELRQLCPMVESIYLSGNHLTHWTDIITLLLALPRLTFLDLTKNPLCSEEIVSNGQPISSTLSTLALNSTGVEWAGVENCLQAVPCLTELYLAKNNYSAVALNSDFSHSSLKRLYLHENSLGDWRELVKLSKAFPQLHTLIASDNPLTTITAVDDSLFPELVVLGLNSTLLDDWTSFEHLAHLSGLRELNVMRVPVANGNGDNQRRWAIIARMPLLDKLNKTHVTPTEREEAERWLLREYDGHPAPPPFYAPYLDKHGTLDKLVDVDLSPRKSVKLEFLFEDGRDAVTRDVKMDQTIAEFKKWVACELVGVPSANLRLLYVDCMGWEGMQVLRLSGRKLYCYKTMSDGDQVHVQVL